MTGNLFTRQSLIDAPIETVFQWHARPGAIERLSPPWDPLKVIRQTGGIQEGAEVLLQMKAGPFPYRWHARHTAFEENVLFQDQQLTGPFSKWIHTHRFEPVGLDRCRLTDEIEYRLPLHTLIGPLAGPLIQNKLERIFRYRHRITRQDIALHRSLPNIRPMTILVSGASGLIGSTLIPFLTTAGHRVVRLVRRTPDSSGDEVFWDPYSGKLDLDSVGPIDAAIHLAGDNIGSGKWTEQKKRVIIESRIKGTTLLSEKLAALDPPPRVMLSASAIGYYGNRGETILNECRLPGSDFISSVCDQWEQAAGKLLEKGIRTAFLRIGVVLSPRGGALQRLLPSYLLGLGGRIGSGSQYISWVDMEDVLGAVYHILTHHTVDGPINLVSPNPVTNTVFSKTLGRVLNRPTLLPIPSAIIRLLFGEMGEEVLLSSTRVMPEKLLETGYRFRNPQLDEALMQMVGKA